MARAPYEARILGSLIRNNDQLTIIRPILNSRDFEYPLFQKVYTRMNEFYTLNGSFDFPLIADSFPNLSGNDAAWMRQVAEGVTVSDEILLNYAKTVKNRSGLTKFKLLAEDILAKTKTVETSVSDLMAATHARIFEIASTNTYQRPTKAECIEEIKKDIEVAKTRELWGFDCGWPTVNKITNGLQKQHLWVVGAYTSIGKSWFCLHMAQKMVNDGAKVLYLSTEMTEKQIVMRLLSIMTELSEFQVKNTNLTLEQFNAWKGAQENIVNMPFFVVSGIENVEEAIFEIRKYKAKEGIDVAVVDFVQNLTSNKDEYETISQNIRKLQNLSMHEDIGMVVASQINRESARDERSSVFGFKGSGAIEQCADIAIVLSREKNDPKRKLICDIRKNRSGMTGQVAMEIDYGRGKIKDVGEYQD